MILAVVALLAGTALLIVVLANRWADTPHGRIKAIFALAFRVQALIDPKAAEGVLSVRPLDTAEDRATARAAFVRDVAALSAKVPFSGDVVDRELAGPGGPLRIRIYSPSQSTQGEGFPLFMYFHGGGFIVGSPEYTDCVTRSVAQKSPAVVVSVDYRLSPEAPYPAAVEDCEFALDWCLENAEALGIRRSAVAVGGDSAGGNLSAVLAQRDASSGRRRIGLQVLIYPAVDASRRDRESQQAFASGYGLSLKDIDTCFRHYVGDGTPVSDPGISPLLAPSLEGLPSALIFTAGFDVLRDEGNEYAERLEKAGVAVEHVREAQVPHGYITMTRVCSEAGSSIDLIASALGKLGASAR